MPRTLVPLRSTPGSADVGLMELGSDPPYSGRSRTSRHSVSILDRVLPRRERWGDHWGALEYHVPDSALTTWLSQPGVSDISDRSTRGAANAFSDSHHAWAASLPSPKGFAMPGCPSLSGYICSVVLLRLTAWQVSYCD